MGYALFTARKMSLQAKVNQYNLQLMQISNKETELTQKTARMQQAHNRIDAGQNAGSFLAQIGGAVGGFVLSGCNPVGAVAGYQLGGVAGDCNAGCFNGEDFVDFFLFEKLIKIFSDFSEQRDVELVIQEAVNFENIAGKRNSVGQNFFL